jgi:hypothetical protein
LLLFLHLLNIAIAKKNSESYEHEMCTSKESPSKRVKDPFEVQNL